MLVLRRGGASIPVLPAAEVRIGMAGAARHNLANALAAVAGAAALGLPVAAMAEALRTLRRRRGRQSRPRRLARDRRRQGPGRLRPQPARRRRHRRPGRQPSRPRRRLVLLGQAGDRTDAEIRALAAAVWAMRPDRIVVKEMESYLRGRRPARSRPCSRPS